MTDRSPPHLELVCFGPPTARVAGQEAPPEVLWRRHLALLVYLGLSPNRTRTRAHLLGLLWPEKPEPKARHALNEALLRLRHCLGPDRLRSVEDAVTLDGAGLVVDALSFSELAERDAEGAAALLRGGGDFLEGFALDEAPAFEDWIMSERQSYRSRAVAVLTAHGANRLAASRFGEASEAARRALVLEPYAEPAVRLLMIACALRGDSTGALAVYHEFSARLADGLGEQPSRELLALSERIRHQRRRLATRAEEEPEPPLVGREGIHRDVFELLGAGLAAGPRTLMITGAPGMGRTRLLAESVRRLALEGAIVALARPLESDHDAPWSTLRLLMRAGLHRAPGLVAADPDALGVLGGLVPELAGRSPLREVRDTAHVAAALVAVLSAVAEESPIGLVIDDAHLSDGATLEALGAAVQQLQGRGGGAPVVLLLSAVEETETAPRQVMQLRGQIGRALRGISVRLGPLAEADVRELVAALAVWCTGDAERERLTRRLTFEASGNPFYLVTLLQGLQRLSTLRHDFAAWPRPEATLDTPLPFSVPNLVRMAIAARIAELGDETKRVLSAASIGGARAGAGAFELDLVATLTELPRARVEDELALAERRNIVAFDGERYAFTAPLIAAVVASECLTPGQRKKLRQRAIVALETREDLEARGLRAELMAAVEPGRAAFEEAVAVARAALAAGTSRTARRALASAERALGQDLESERPRLDALRAELGE